MELKTHMKHEQTPQAVEALGQQPVPDENAEAVMGAHSNGEIIIHGFFVVWEGGGCLLDKSFPGVGGLERRHSSTEGGSFRGEPVVKITVNR